MSKRKKKILKPTDIEEVQAVNKKMWIGLSTGALLMAVAIYGLVQPPEANAEAITVYKSPTCGCCKKWVSHLENNDFDVSSHDRNDMASLKKRHQLKPEHQSCHTAVIKGYVIEGHVPASDIQRLLAERPDIHGLTAPGMPMGSPGMEGPRKDAYDVLAIDKQGNTTVFSQH